MLRLGALGLVGLALLVLPACCPIPMQRLVTVRPELTVIAKTHEDKPAPDVKLTVRRIITGPPPGAETERWQGRTGPDGTARFDEIRTKESYLPLMMHGVNWYGWEVCAEHPKFGAGTARYDGRTPVIGQEVALELALDPARTDCEWRQLEHWGRPE